MQAKNDVIVCGDEKKQKEAYSPPSIKKWKSAKELYDLGLKEAPTLWSPYIIKTGLVGITGPSESNKSTFIRGLAAAIAMRRKAFLGYPLNVEHGRSLLVLTEDGMYQTAANLRRYFENSEVPEAMDDLMFMFDSESLIKDLDEKLTYRPADIVFLDTWSDSFNGNINNIIEVRQSLNELSAIAEKHKTVIMIVHHNGKNSEKMMPDKNKLNGSQGIEAKLRLLLELRPSENENERILSVVKCNYLSDTFKNQSLVLRLDPDRFVLTQTGITVDKKTINSANTTRRFSPELWLPRLDAIRKKHNWGIGKATLFLKSKNPQQEVPSATWFKNHFKESEENSKPSNSEENNQELNTDQNAL